MFMHAYSSVCTEYLELVPVSLDDAGGIDFLDLTQGVGASYLTPVLRPGTYP